MDEVSEFAKQIFTSSLTDSSNKKPVATKATPHPLKINFGELASDNTAVSVQLVVWAMSEESGKSLLVCHTTH